MNHGCPSGAPALDSARPPRIEYVRTCPAMTTPLRNSRCGAIGTVVAAPCHGCPGRVGIPRGKLKKKELAERDHERKDGTAKSVRNQLAGGVLFSTQEQPSPENPDPQPRQKAGYRASTSSVPVERVQSVGFNPTVFQWRDLDEQPSCESIQDIG